MLDGQYKEKTEDSIHKEMLNSVDDSYEKSQGNLVFDVLRAIAIQLSIIWTALQRIVLKRDVTNLEDEELDLYVEQNSYIKRKPSTYAFCDQVEVTGNGVLSIHDVFETESGIAFHPDKDYTVSGSQIINVVCMVPGEVGNVPAHAIQYMPATIKGITSVNNLVPSRDGFNQESDASLIARYLEAKRTPATSGNKHHYLVWAKNTYGVGDAEVLSLERGPNTLEIVVVDRDFRPASDEIVSNAQAYIDPGSNGRGEGQAPIGAHAYVVSATGLPVNVNMCLTLTQGYEKDQVMINLQESLSEYFKTLFRANQVSYAKVGKVVIDTEGVEDYTDLTLNGGTAPISIPRKQVPIVGEVNVS